MSWIDWSIVFGVIAFFIFTTYRSRKYSKSVADFLAANRSAGRYLLMMSGTIASLGAISVVAMLQRGYKIGLGSWQWEGLLAPVTLLIVISGWVVYRFRETRALTLGQFLEMRYTKRFRIFAAIICWSSGIINFGIVPAVAANFFINYCGLPSSYSLIGITIPTYHSLVFFLISLALYFTFSGGQVVVLIIDFLQSFFCYMVFLAILVVLLIKFPLSEIFEGLLIAEKGKSMVNPFACPDVDGYDPLYFIIFIVGYGYTTLAWQGKQAYHSSAKSPHEAKMAAILGRFQWDAFLLSIVFVPLVAYMIMHHPNYADQAQLVTERLSHVENDQVRDQMLVPVTMTLYMPIGLMGAFAAVMFAAFISTNDTLLHSWGSIFVQDVVVPLLKKPLAPKQHIRLLRSSICFVALFIFIFSCFYRQTQHIMLFMAITGAIWMGGAGSVIIGGLYTCWGSTIGAYAALITGATIAVAGIVLDQLWNSWYGINFFLTGQEMFLVSMIASIIAYTVFSIIFKHRKYNLDKLLHRGKYIVESDHATAEAATSVSKWNLKQALGITKDFTFWDKFIYGLSITHTTAFFMAIFTMSMCALAMDISDSGWAIYHRYVLRVYIGMSFMLAAWLFTGGICNLVTFFKDMKSAKRDFTDDGRVTDHDYQESNKAQFTDDD